MHWADARVNLWGVDSKGNGMGLRHHCKEPHGGFSNEKTPPWTENPPISPSAPASLYYKCREEGQRSGKRLPPNIVRST
jgi:hypothetical protein